MPKKMMKMNSELRAGGPHLTCGMCKWFRVDADRAESLCKRLDHKHLKLAVPWFKAYDCGQFAETVCDEFEPAAWCLYLSNHWTSIADYKARRERMPEYLWLVIDNNTQVRYAVPYSNFMQGSFLNEDGTLRWVKRMRYRQSRSSPTGYELECEGNDNDD